MEYPFLCSVARSVLQKLDHCKLESFGDANDIKEDVKKLKGILSYLPSILEIRESSIKKIQRSVFGLHDLLRGPVPYGSKSCWRDLVLQLTEFQDHLQSLSSKKHLSSIYYELPEFEGQVVKKWKLPPHLVPCLAYCALYPKSHRIVRETLVNQWMAEGFLDLPAADSSSGDTELEDIGDSYFMELFSKGVFVEPMFCFGGNISNQQEAVTVHSCVLHLEIHEFALGIAGKEVLVDDSNPFDLSCTMYVAVQKNAPIHAIKVILEHPCPIRAFMSFVPDWSSRQFRHSLSSNQQILDLSGTQIEHLSIIPWECQLRYLAFSRNYHLKWIDLDMISMHIQTLAVDGCVQLKVVNLERTRLMRHLYYTSRETELKIHNSSLRILQLSECPDLSSLSLGSVENFSALRRLRIYKCPALFSLPDIMDLLTRVEELVFHNCARLNLNLGRSMDSLPKLQHMELIGLPKLTNLPVGLKSASKALKYLLIADCCSLKSTDPVLQKLAVLEKLFVYNCPNLSIDPRVFESLNALQSLDMTLNLSKTTFSAREDLGPFISNIGEVILDGRLFCPNADSLGGKDADLEPQTPSFAQTETLLERNFPYFILSMEASKEPKSSKDASSEDKLTHYDESDEECAETPSTSADTPSTSV